MSIKKLSELDTFTKRFSYIVDKIKERKLINQSKIAEQIGLSTAALSKLKKGDSKSAAGTTLTALQSNFDVNSVWLTENVGEPFLPYTGEEKEEFPPPHAFEDLKKEFDKQPIAVFFHQLIGEKEQHIETLTRLIEDLREDKKRLNKTIDRLHGEIDELKRELGSKEKAKNSA